jgi:hypothetical protein
MFVRCELAKIWDLWWSGNLSLHYPPYRFLQPIDLANKGDRNFLSKAKVVIAKLLELCEKTEIDVINANLQERDLILERSYKKLHETIKYEKGFTCVGQKQYVTVYDLVRKLN